ncbi:unnamed protein product [Strongylus vulgaris]|uniref:GINS complex subunit 2 n=1 Tax=Strongylus vulgaris TaxID=40348 RepID=A0A3P7IRN6_STRVU|nr:unnamed protein product [Strongylus vulgaris]
MGSVIDQLNSKQELMSKEIELVRRMAKTNWLMPPSWFTLDELKRLVAIEGETEGLSHLPPFIFEISNILVRAAKEDLVDGDQIKVLMQDLWDKREAKLRTSSLKLLSQHAHAHVRLDDVQPLEVAAIRPNISACKQIARLVRNAHNVQPD